MSDWLRFDWARAARTGLPEAVLATGKSTEQVAAIARAAVERDSALLFTRMQAEQVAAVHEAVPGEAHHDSDSSTVSIGRMPPRPELAGSVAVVAAGSGDLGVAAEAHRTLWFHGVDDVPLVVDVGVAGLWRLMERIEELRSRRVLVAAAGMEGALFSVLGGLVQGLVVAVPTSVGYGVSAGGRAALGSALASCAPGVVTVNIDNGFGAACAALKALGPPPRRTDA